MRIVVTSWTVPPSRTPLTLTAVRIHRNASATIAPSAGEPPSPGQKTVE